MIVGIVELMHAHLTLINTLYLIYTAGNSKIIIFTTEDVKDRLPEYQDKAHVQFVIKEKQQSNAAFLDVISTYTLDQLYFTTLTHSLKEFREKTFACKTSLFIHNINLWKKHSFIHNSIRALKDANLFNLNDIKYRFKQYVLFGKERQKIIEKVKRNPDYSLVVLNQILKRDLSKLIDKEKISIIPFMAFNNTENLNKAQGDKITICIPGRLDTNRRDYFSVFRVLRNHVAELKHRIELDLLGGQPIGNDKHYDIVINEVEELKKLGYSILTYSGFISIDDYDKRVKGADILLGNLNLDSKVGKKYGLNKDTGVVYNMIYAGKPAILPKRFELQEDLKPATIFYNSPDELKDIFLDLASDEKKLQNLTSTTLKISEHYHPKTLFNNLHG